MPDIDIDFDDRRRGEMVRYAADKWGQRPGRPGHHLRHHQNQSGAEGFGADPLRPARVRDRRPDHQGAAAGDHGQRHSAVGHHRPQPRAVQGSRRGPRPDRHRPRRPHHLPDRARPGGSDPQRRRARLRGDHEQRAADRGDPAVEAAAGRRHHHRLGLPVVRGHRPAEDGLPRPAQPDDHRRRDREHQGQQGHRPRPGIACRSTTRPPTSCWAAATRWACSSSTAGRCATCCAACSPPGSRTSSRSSRCTGPARWA